MNTFIKRTVSLLTINIILGALHYAKNNFKGLTGLQAYSIASGITALKPYIENLQHTQEDKIKEYGLFMENNAIMSPAYKDARKAIAAKYGIEMDDKGNPQGSLENMRDLNNATPELQKAYAEDKDISAYNKDINSLMYAEMEISVAALDVEKILSSRDCPPSVAWGLNILTLNYSENINKGKEHINLSPNQAATLSAQFDKFNQQEVGLNSETAFKVGSCLDVLRSGLRKFAQENPKIPQTEEELKALTDLANKPQSWFLPTFKIEEFANDNILNVEPDFFVALEWVVKPEQTTGETKTLN